MSSLVITGYDVLGLFNDITSFLIFFCFVRLFVYLPILFYTGISCNLDVDLCSNIAVCLKMIAVRTSC